MTSPVDRPTRRDEIEELATAIRAMLADPSADLKSP